MTDSFLPSDQTLSLYTIEEIRQIETVARANLAPGSLMRTAGLAAANLAKALAPINNQKILALAGPGDNGGDALEAAHLLAESGYAVNVILCAETDRYSPDAQHSLQRAKVNEITWISPEQLRASDDQQWSLVIDGLFGIGLARPITGEIESLVHSVNQMAQHSRCPVLALDVPSGLNADTGQIIGGQGVAIHATHTITFIGNKLGLHTATGKDIAGEVMVADLGIADNVFPSPHLYLSHPSLFRRTIKPRRHDSHKGSHGDVLIIGGAGGMTGAAILAARSALYCGAGRVYVGFIDDVPAYDHQHPELMCRPAGECDLSKGVVVIGPGLGTSTPAAQLLSKALTEASALVIDADALNLIAQMEDLRTLLVARQKNHRNTIITPHPLEAARLLGVSALEVQCDRITSANNLVAALNACVILKGAGTIIAAANEATFINSTGNPGLATAGTGDVLAGICAALLAQGAEQNDAARLAVWLHGLAADTLKKQGIGPTGMTASELIPAIRACLNEFISDNADKCDEQGIASDKKTLSLSRSNSP